MPKRAVSPTWPMPRFIEDNDRYTDGKGKRQRYLASDTLILVGVAEDTVELPFAPVVDLEAPRRRGKRQ